MEALDPDYTHSVIGLVGAADYIFDTTGMSYTPRMIKNAVARYELDQRVICGKRRFRPVDLVQWAVCGAID